MKLYLKDTEAYCAKCFGYLGEYDRAGDYSIPCPYCEEKVIVKAKEKEAIKQAHLTDF